MKELKQVDEILIRLLISMSFCHSKQSKEEQDTLVLIFEGPILQTKSVLVGSSQMDNSSFTHRRNHSFELKANHSSHFVIFCNLQHLIFEAIKKTFAQSGGLSIMVMQRTFSKVKRVEVYLEYIFELFTCSICKLGN